MLFQLRPLFVSRMARNQDETAWRRLGTRFVPCTLDSECKKGRPGFSDSLSRRGRALRPTSRPDFMTVERIFVHRYHVVKY